MDYRKNPEAWADAFLDQHRTTARRDAEADREAAARKLRELPPVTRWMLTRGGHAPDLDTIERIGRASRRQTTFQKWEAIFTILGVVLLCLFGLAWSSSW